MKSRINYVHSLYGLVLSVSYFAVVLFMYSEFDVLHVFPVFAGEDDFLIRRQYSSSILVPSVIVFGVLFGSRITSDKQLPKERVFYMLLSSVLFGVTVFGLKDSISSIDERDYANVGVFFYFLILSLFNFFAFFFVPLLFRDKCGGKR